MAWMRELTYSLGGLLGLGRGLPGGPADAQPSRARQVEVDARDGQLLRG